MFGRRALAAIVAVLALAVTGTPGWTINRIHVPAVSTPWPGKILVGHDEWALSDFGFSQAPDARQFALNVAAWFTGGRPGRFLVYSTVIGFTESDLAATMRGAGHEWTVDSTADFSLATLLQYDAVFVGGNEADNAVLIDYVRAGGGVFLQGGTGIGGDVFEAAHWNTFLNAFGLSFDPNYNLARLPGVYPVTSTAPLFNGVRTLYEQYGNTISKLDARDPNARILMTSDQGRGLYALYETTAIPVAIEICPNRLTVQSRGPLSVAIGGSGRLDVRAIDPASLRLLGAAPRSGLYNYGVLTWTGPLLGRAHLGGCGAGRTDRHLDLVLRFESGDVVREIQRSLGRRLVDGDAVAVTLTGRLKRELGGRPIVGEDLVVAHRWWSR